ncbi:hypothetical protein BSL78_27989 [Apostichopus japonicus]|uniref:Uncharacterized protein n=1 Tax=Stichopus japonicus TaxID=307972 RepID=A0A2G8JHG5_STIJA|nr:hypothetical protein BSL78_27989 [Apostichopus japonicus]
MKWDTLLSLAGPEMSIAVSFIHCAVGIDRSCCNARFSQRSSMAMHRKRHSSDGVFLFSQVVMLASLRGAAWPCTGRDIRLMVFFLFTGCNDRFSQRSSMAMHRKRHSSDGVFLFSQVVMLDSLKGAAWPCTGRDIRLMVFFLFTGCNARFSQRSSMAMHRKRRSSDGVFLFSQVVMLDSLRGAAWPCTGRDIRLMVFFLFSQVVMLDSLRGAAWPCTGRDIRLASLTEGRCSYSAVPLTTQDTESVYGQPLRVVPDDGFSVKFLFSRGISPARSLICDLQPIRHRLCRRHVSDLIDVNISQGSRQCVRDSPEYHSNTATGCGPTASPRAFVTGGPGDHPNTAAGCCPAVSPRVIPWRGPRGHTDTATGRRTTADPRVIPGRGPGAISLLSAIFPGRAPECFIPASVRLCEGRFERSGQEVPMFPITAGDGLGQGKDSELDVIDSMDISPPSISSVTSSVVPTSFVLTSSPLTLRDPTTGAHFIQNQLLQDDPPDDTDISFPWWPQPQPPTNPPCTVYYPSHPS